MGLNITIHCDSPRDPVRREIDWDGIQLVDARWAGYAPSAPPQVLSMDSLRKAMNAMYANSGRMPDRVVLSPAQMRMVADYLVRDVVASAEED